MKAVKSAPAGRGPKGKAAKTASVPSNRDQVQAIREWAKSAGSRSPVVAGSPR